MVSALEDLTVQWEETSMLGSNFSDLLSLLSLYRNTENEKALSGWNATVSLNKGRLEKKRKDILSKENSTYKDTHGKVKIYQQPDVTQALSV